MTTLDPMISDQGFKRFPPIDSTTGGTVEVYDSSDAGHLWLHASGLSDPHDGHSDLVEVTAQLSLANARLLRNQLTYLIDNANG